MMEIRLRQPHSFVQLGRRSNQEDARFPDCDTPQDCRPAFVVCDGVGGCDKGEVASRTVADAIGGAMEDYDLSAPFGVRDFSRVLDCAYGALDRMASPANAGMATTMTFVCFHGAGVFTAHIGDSRIYHVRPGVGIMHRSEDHSLVSALVHSGNITPQQAVNHPQSNVITRCMSASARGARAEASTLQIKDVEPGDYFFLATDGVQHGVDDEALYRILCSQRSDKDKMAEIASLCARGSDNSTATLVCVESVDGATLSAPHDMPGSGATEHIDTPDEVVVETSAPRKRGVAAYISDIINKLF